MARHRLDRITVEGFKSIRAATVELRPLNLLIGANGSGKSNLVAVFKLLNRLVEERLQEHTRKVGASNLLYCGPKLTQQIFVRAEFDKNTYEVRLELAHDDSLYFAHEIGYFLGGAGHSRPYNVDLGAGHLESRLAQGSKTKPVVKFIRDALNSWVVYHFHDTSDQAAVKGDSPINDNDRLRPDASNLAAFLFRLSQTREPEYRRIVGAIRQVAPFFKDFRLKPDRLKPDRVRLEWSAQDTDAYFDAHALSDGTLRFICLATLLMQPDLPSLMLIDEPELGLHPYAIGQLAELMKSASNRAQLIVATQSVTLLNQFDPDDVLVVDRKDGQSTFARISPDELATWVDDYSLGELWEKNVIGGRPRR